MVLQQSPRACRRQGVSKMEALVAAWLAHKRPGGSRGVALSGARPLQPTPAARQRVRVKQSRKHHFSGLNTFIGSPHAVTVFQSAPALERRCLLASPPMPKRRAAQLVSPTSSPNRRLSEQLGQRDTHDAAGVVCLIKRRRPTPYQNFQPARLYLRQLTPRARRSPVSKQSKGRRYLSTTERCRFHHLTANGRIVPSTFLHTFPVVNCH